MEDGLGVSEVLGSFHASDLPIVATPTAIIEACIMSRVKSALPYFEVAQGSSVYDAVITVKGER